MQGQRVVTAGAMATAVQFDPQFTVPVRPRFPRELVLVPLADGLLVDGTDELQVLRGRATKTLLPALIQLLDGGHSTEQLVSMLPDVPAEHVRQAIALLYTRGLLEDGSDDPSTAEAFDADTLSFFRRHVDVTRVNRSAWQAARRLLDAEVIVYATGGDEVQASVARQLRAAGVGKVSLANFNVPLTPGTQAGARLAVALVDGDDQREQLTWLDRQCGLVGIPWLRVAVNSAAGTADLGPYFDQDETACYECFRRVDQVPPGPAEVAAERDAKLDARFWSGMLVVEAVSLLSRILPAATALSTVRFDLTNWTSQTLQFPRLPGCPNCRPLPGVEAGAVPTALVYESAVRFPSRHLIDPKQHQVHYRPSNLELALEGKRYPSLEKLALPERGQLARLAGNTLDHVSHAAVPATTSLGLTELTSLLLFGAGIREAEPRGPVTWVKPKRWAATGGNLGSVELYVAALNVDGLEAGLYFYQTHEHVLARMLRGGTASDVAEFVRNAIDREDERMPDALILSVGALHRLAHKYGTFAYRITNLDAGVALAQMQMAGSSLGLRTRLARRWNDELIADWLDLNDLSEPVTGALLIHGHLEPEGRAQ